MTTIRPYQESDFDEICSWWVSHGDCPPLPGMMITDGTFVVEVDGVLVMTLTAFVTQSKEVSYLEGYCAKPGLDKKLRNELGQSLWEYAYEFLRQNGYKRVVIFTNKDALAKRYRRLGMNENVRGLISLGRTL